MIAHQKPRLVIFSRKNRSVKLNIRTETIFENLNMMMEEMTSAVKNLYMLYLQPASISVMRMN